MQMLSQRYKQLIGRCALLLVVGMALQFLWGNVNPSFLTYPWTLVLVVNYLYLLILLYAKQDTWKFVRGLYDRPAYIVSLSCMLVLTLFFGMIRQDGSTDGFWGWMGFTSMSSSWVFVLFLVHFMSILGLKAIDDVHHWKQRRWSTVLMHVSVFIILASAIFGSGEKIRVRVTAMQGHPVSVGITSDGRQVELPFMLRLNKFTLEEYPPHIYLFDGNRLSEDFLVVDGEGTRGELDAWQVECLEYLHSAGRMSEDSAYVSTEHVGATTAMYLKATSAQASVEGWVSQGSFLFAGSTLALPDGRELVMPRREVKKYLSEVELFEGEDKHVFEISVNHPASIGAWKIYQSGYDSSKGRWSTTSVLECVKDAWYPAIHIAMWMILLGGAMMFVSASKKKKKEDRV